MVLLSGRNPTELRLIFTLDFIYQRQYHRLESWNLFFLNTPYLQSYADAVAGKGAPSYNCFGFVNGTITRICRPVLNEKVVYSHHTRIHGVKFPSMVLPNGLIINLQSLTKYLRLFLVFMGNRVL